MTIKRALTRCVATAIIAVASAALLATGTSNANAESKAPTNPAPLKKTCHPWFN